MRQTKTQEIATPVMVAGIVGLVVLALAWLFRAEIIRVVFVEQSNQRPGAKIVELGADEPRIWRPAANQ
jgi:hypothetical protein